MRQIDHLLRYASHGWPVLRLHTVEGGVCSCENGIRCKAPGEHARKRNWRRDATTDHSEIQKQWRKPDAANVGVVTGRDSGIVAIVVDPKKGGFETLRRLQLELGQLPRSVSWLTGQCGPGFIFRHPKQGRLRSKSLGPGVMLLGDGDFIVLPPSRDSSGDRCVWQDGMNNRALRPVELPPAWLSSLRGLGPSGSVKLELTTAADVLPKQIEWLWPERIPLGKLSVVAGRPGLGKSQVAAFLAATVSIGGKLPSDEGCAPLGSVLLLAAEDDFADTIRPRLEAAGADLSRVHMVGEVTDPVRGRRPFDFSTDLKQLEETIGDRGDVRLLIIDPMSAFHRRGADLRIALTCLQDLATKLKVAIVAITHLNKAKSNSVMTQVQGPTAVTAVARNVLIVTSENGSDRRLLIPAKDNLGGIRTGLAFRIVSRTTTSAARASAVLWEADPITLTADEASADGPRGSGGRGSLTDAEDFLRVLLSAGPVAAKEVCAEAADAGISPMTLRRAADAIGAKSRRVGGIAGKGQWYWEMDAKVIDAKVITGDC
jgi:putative DNA primase/helicase